MPTPTKGPRLGAGPAHERLMLANLATALFEHGGITTTHAKAKRLRPLAERLITAAKRGDLHARRRVLTVVRDKGVVHTLFAEIGPRFAERPGGYTRITKLGPRKGDNAPMARIELVEAHTVAQEAVGEAERARGSRFRLPSRRTAGSVAMAPAAPAVSTEGDTEGTPEQTDPPAPVPTEGDTDGAMEATDAPTDGGADAPTPALADRGDPQVPAEPTGAAGDGREDATSAQAQLAGAEAPAEGDDDETARGEPS